MREERGPLLPKGWYMGAPVATKEDLEFPCPMRVMEEKEGVTLEKNRLFSRLQHTRQQMQSQVF